jgi:hypothetical protein
MGSKELISCVLNNETLKRGACTNFETQKVTPMKARSRTDVASDGTAFAQKDS